MASDPEFITIVVPALDEESCIERTVSGLLPEDDSYELLVVDGGSRDRTRHLVLAMAEKNPRIRLIANPGRIQACAVNLAAQVADPRSRTIVRADAHCSYPPGWARQVASALSARRAEGAASVVVPMITVGTDSSFQTAVAAAQNSRFGNGGSAHRRRAGDAGWIDHGHHAAFDREFFLSIGGYDETFAVNEDAELDIRVHKAGGRVWLESPALIQYHPRKTVRSLWKQYYGYGKGRARTVLKHRSLPKLRQMLPVGVMAACAGSLALSTAWPGLIAVPVAYAGACAVAGQSCVRPDGGIRDGLLSGASLWIMHMAWACGFFRGVAAGGRAV